MREGNTRGLFEKRTVASLLTGEPEYLIPLGEETPEGWIVTGYPWDQITDAPHKAFIDAYRAKFNDTPRLGSFLGYVRRLHAARPARQGRLHRHREADRHARRTSSSTPSPGR